ncbi:MULTISPECIES: hypothetical protein [Pseudomonas]|uniref:hypothetical protein n=1 Tax=Pseudomonas TaxID=286 RepID=UPI0023614B6B|nr:MULTISPECIES: hypothetical protein [Pseudomonas]WJV23726.1 hypothetical protein PSR66_29540 [Pseudomonas chlororaphis]
MPPTKAKKQLHASSDKPQEKAPVIRGFFMPAEYCPSLKRQTPGFSARQQLFALGILLEYQYAAPHLCASTCSTGQIRPTRQMIFSPSPTASRKSWVYVLQAGAVYQK